MPKLGDRFEERAIIDGFFNKSEFLDLWRVADPIS
jgi:hypothetical protein